MIYQKSNKEENEECTVLQYGIEQHCGSRKLAQVDD